MSRFSDFSIGLKKAGLVAALAVGASSFIAQDAFAARGLPCDGQTIEISDSDSIEAVPVSVPSVFFEMEAGNTVTLSGGSLTGLGSGSVFRGKDELCSLVTGQTGQCAGIKFTAPEDGIFSFSITVQASPDNSVSGTVSLTCNVGNDAEEAAEALDKVIKQVFRSTMPSASSLAASALSGFAGLNDGMVALNGSPNTEGNDLNDRLSLMGQIDDDEFAVGFEQKLGAIQGFDLHDGTNTLVGNVRYYDFGGAFDGDSWQAQIGIRHRMQDGNDLTVFGTYRDSDIDADSFAIGLEEKAYGVGAILSGTVSDALKGSFLVSYETGEADIEINNVKGDTDTTRLTAAFGLQGERKHKNLLLKPRIGAGIVRFDRDGYTDNAATTFAGSNDSETFMEAGVRITPIEVEDGKLNWFLDGSVDYVSETLDGLQTLSGRTIRDRSTGGNFEGGFAFDMENGATITVSAGSAGLGREARSNFGNARFVMPLQKRR